MDKSEFGYRLTHRRVMKKFTRQHVAERAQISLSALASYERGEKTPPVDIAERLAEVLDVSLDWLTGRDFENGGKLDSWEDAINALGIILADIPQITIMSYPHYYVYNGYGAWKETKDKTNDVCTEFIIRLPFKNPDNDNIFFPEDACEMMERVLPLVQKNSLTREQFIVLINDLAKKHKERITS